MVTPAVAVEIAGVLNVPGGVDRREVVAGRDHAAVHKPHREAAGLAMPQDVALAVAVVVAGAPNVPP
jgi:hypothetical protein